jgi:hypothetical protein
MSKTWREQTGRKHPNTPQKAIDRISMREAKEDIREALSAPQGGQRAN